MKYEIIKLSHVFIYSYKLNTNDCHYYYAKTVIPTPECSKTSLYNIINKSKYNSMYL